ncbi:MAG: InlB B-repeat-containing protein [Clostridiales bacterium]|jgi:hypothetical protein|nr:InlB B-repeat-containing protein [Clostridiales bacterium]
MKNAFKILGAEPTDDGERLKELLEEKQLLLDDDKESSEAYTELTNPKKRIKHEIIQWSDNMFEDFDEFFKQVPETSVDDICSTIVDFGSWFEDDFDGLLDVVNENRGISGFPILEDITAISSAISELRNDSIEAITTFCDNIKEYSLIAIFNALVKMPDFQSFFVDELLAHYELKIKDSLQAKEKACADTFAEIERLCNLFNNGGSLPDELGKKVSVFYFVLADWDTLAQPLQVNIQRRGGQHEESSDFVHDIRNRVIVLCNRSQESLNQLLGKLNQSDYFGRLQVRTQLPQKLADSIAFTDIILKLIDILQGVFAEIELTAEQLKEDKKAILQLRNTFSTLLAQADPYGKTRPSGSNGKKISWSTFANGKKTIPAFGVAVVFALIVMIIGFATGVPALGVAFLIVAVTMAILCGAGKKIKGNNKAIAAIVIIPIILILSTVIPIAVATRNNSSTYTPVNNGSVSTSYTVTLNKQGGSGGTSSVTVKNGSAMPSATAPSKSGYTFGGYYASTNGSGTQYYTASMSSARAWNLSSNTTLYAKWIEDEPDYTKITLTASNFETYFTLTDSCSNSGTTATYSYSIQPKNSSYASNSNSSSSISVTFKVGFYTSAYSSLAVKTETFSITLYRSSGYKTSDTKTIYSIPSNASYYAGEASSVSGTLCY